MSPPVSAISTCAVTSRRRGWSAAVRAGGRREPSGPRARRRSNAARPRSARGGSALRHATRRDLCDGYGPTYSQQHIRHSRDPRRKSSGSPAPEYERRHRATQPLSSRHPSDQDHGEHSSGSKKQAAVAARFRSHTRHFRGRTMQHEMSQPARLEAVPTTGPSCGCGAPLRRQEPSRRADDDGRRLRHGQDPDRRTHWYPDTAAPAVGWSTRQSARFPGAGHEHAFGLRERVRRPRKQQEQPG